MLRVLVEDWLFEAATVPQSSQMLQGKRYIVSEKQHAAVLDLEGRSAHAIRKRHSVDVEGRMGDWPRDWGRYAHVNLLSHATVPIYTWN